MLTVVLPDDLCAAEMKIRDMVSRVTAQMKNEKLKMKNKELKSKKLEAGIERSSFCVCFASHFSLFIIHF